MQGSANLTIMIKAARSAARKLVRDFQEVENLQASVRGAEDFVARAEAEALRTVRDILTSERPNYGWTGAGSDPVEGKDPTRRWIVDPLQGGQNFAHGLPHWCISIALEHKGDVVAGVIFDVPKDDLFWAERGAGAFMNDRRMRVSGRARLIDCVFATGLPSGARPDLPLTLKDLARLLPASAGVRRWGVPALDLAYVAAGRSDGYWERRLSPWDAAAGMILVREAGGFVEPLAGEDVFGSATIVAANSEVFQPFAKLLRED
ncbi:inositol monophosphatase family protein [Palleronia rufa]|uniref:inositol monophosphatase family protein n=1 Tax=Palleronia rufa TaxID=1530186 RepID=UPI0005620772|nr:inositol monophosphatase family protein [Palleronia rufa]